MRSPATLATSVLWIVFATCFSKSTAQDPSAKKLQPKLVSVKRIWSEARHNAFTDLVRWKGKFYCAFREGQGHAGDRGKLRIITSQDGDKWASAGLLEMPQHDLRDAALSITPQGQLMVLGGAQQNADGKRKTGTFVSFSSDGKKYTQPKIVIPEGRWLWRVTWHKNNAYGVSYGAPENRKSSALHQTSNGIDYQTVTASHLDLGGWPTEARIRFDQDDTAYSLHRRDGTENSAMLGTSKHPYTNWEWKDLGVRFGGPNFIKLPNENWIGAGRLYDGGARTEIVKLDVKKGELEPLLRLPSGGDTSYPGMVWHNGFLWVSYYSSHEGKTNIYLAKIEFPSLTPPVKVGSRRELFVDNHLVESMSGTELRLHHPRPCEEVLKFDKPWEGRFCGYVTVLKDNDTYRMYYRGLPAAGGDGTDREVTCYAESQDGIRWTKPDVGIYEINGSKKNNVVLKGQTPASHNFSPFIDSRPGVPATEKFKALGGTAKGLIAFTSADGKKWRRLQQQPVFTKGIFDSQNVSFYSPAEKCYLCYFRTWTGKGYRGFRSISRTTSKDFIHWTDPVPMTFGDTPNEHLYTNQTFPYSRAPHISVAVAARFMPGRKVLTTEDAKRIDVDPKYFGDISDAVLLTTRGGNRYDRTFMESFVRPGIGLENWVSRTNYPALGIVQTNDNELSLYIQKNYGQPTSHLRRYTLRVDGFSSIHANYERGEVQLKPLIFGSVGQLQNAVSTENISLHMNLATSAAGGVRVELQDMTGKPVPGFSLQECDELIGDRTNFVVSWKGKSNLRSLAGQIVRVRIVMKDANLYSLQFK